MLISKYLHFSIQEQDRRQHKRMDVHDRRFGRKISYNPGRKLNHGYNYKEPEIQYEDLSMPIQNNYNSKSFNENRNVR